MRKGSVILLFKSSIDDIGFTGIRDRNSERKYLILGDLPKEVLGIESRNVSEDDSSDVPGKGMKLIISSNIFDIWTRFEVLIRLNFSGHSLTKASILILGLYGRSEIQNEQQFRNALA